MLGSKEFLWPLPIFTWVYQPAQPWAVVWPTPVYSHRNGSYTTQAVGPDW